MGTFRLLILASVIVQASPTVVTTVITDQQFKTATLGGADDATFLCDFAGISRGTPFKHFKLTPKGSNWVMSAEVDQPEPSTTSPQAPGGQPPEPHQFLPDPPKWLQNILDGDSGGPVGSGGGEGGSSSHNVPEIDPGSGLSALALVSGGLLVIRGRRKTQGSPADRS